MRIFTENKRVTMEVKKFTFNPVGENTYVLYDESGECIIIDPGCCTSSEKATLEQFIVSAGLKPVKLVLTHSHFDHIMGNKFVCDRFGLQIYAHELAAQGIEMLPSVTAMYGIPSDPSPEISVTIAEGGRITFGNTELEILFCPGHSPDSLVFYHAGQKIAIAGDVLFYGSIGRTDLPGGDHETLIRSIREKMFLLPDETVVYCGHGPETTIGHEKRTNPFLS